MDDLKTYIETGILELYALGDVTPEERAEVERMISIHPELKAELIEIEKAMEAYALANAVEPSENQRSKILNSLVTNLADDRAFKSKKTPTDDNVVVMPVREATNFYKYAFAASVTLLLASVIALYNMNNQLKQSNLQLAVLSAQNQQISKTVSYKDQQLVVFRDTTYKLMRLKPVGKVPTANMTIAWSPAKKKVIIDMVALNMPQNDKDHQYQLWALVGGKPVDLGVFDKTQSDSSEMKEMKSVSSADAFAVTLEPRGGSVNPTMSELMVLGK